LVRAEFGLTQDAMATAIGISKKTLVDIEKGRRSLGWTGGVALVCLFGGGQVLTSVFGPTPLAMLWPMLTEDGLTPEHRAVDLPTPEAPATTPDLAAPSDDSPEAHPGSRWWQVVARNSIYTIEQNIVSQHYRLLDTTGARLASAFDIDELLPTFDQGETS